jgi:hypothetical protein
MKLPGGHRLGGRIELSAKGAGSLASPAGSASLSIDSRPVDGSPALGRIAIAATAANHEAIVNASAERFNVEARAVIGLARPWPATLKARANDLPLDTLPVNVAARPDGRLRATLNATGNLTELSRAVATAEIETLSGSWNGQPFRVTTAGPLRYENQRLGIEELELTARDSSLKVTGDLPLTARATAGEATIDARANLATLTAYLPRDAAISGEGTATVAGTLRGTLDSIAPDLVVTVENGAVSSPALALAPRTFSCVRGWPTAPPRSNA